MTQSTDDKPLLPHQEAALGFFHQTLEQRGLLMVLRCPSKLCPDDEVFVIVAAIPNERSGMLHVIPLLRLFEEPPMQQLHAPSVYGVKLTEVRSTHNPMGGHWEIPLESLLRLGGKL